MVETDSPNDEDALEEIYNKVLEIQNLSNPSNKSVNIKRINDISSDIILDFNDIGISNGS